MKAFGISYMISGGNSLPLPLLLEKKIPKGINNLRLGNRSLGQEALMVRYPYASKPFTLHAEIIEVQTKPSYPIGEIGLNSFGEKPEFTDLGLMKRAIVALGKQDVQLDNLIPLDSLITILGGSSDHLIIDVSKTSYQVGDILQFNLNYPGLLQRMTSSYVKKEIINN